MMGPNKMALWSMLVVVAPLVVGQDECTEPTDIEVCNGVDDDGDGYIDEGFDKDYDGYLSAESCPDLALTDCDDNNPDVNPGQPELCNGVDDDCSGKVDDDVRTVYFLDADGDGFGTDDTVSCKESDGFVSARGDCDDQDPAVYPGADDPDRDGIDQDCGGSVGPDPHVGLGETSFSTIGEALASAAPGVTVWVGPATYLEAGIHITADRVRIAAVDPHGSTTVDGQGSGPVFVIDGKETDHATLDGLTISGGWAESGGGLEVLSASATVSGCTVQGNSATNAGGGIYVSKGTLDLRYSSIEQNTAHLAAGVAIDQGTGTIHGCSITGNASTTSGGGLYLDYSDVVVTGTQVTANAAGYRGAGLFADQTTLTAAGDRFHENRCTDIDGEGGGLFLNTVSGSFVALSLRGNRADIGGGLSAYWADVPFRFVHVLANQASQGGGLSFSFSTPRLEHCLITENAADSGGGIYAYMSRLDVTHCTVVGNSAGWGGGVLLAQQMETSSFANSVFAYNVGHNLQNLSDIEQEVTWSDLYSEDGPNDNVWLSTGSFEIDPMFVRFIADGDPDDDDLHILPVSPLRDGAQPGEQDMDGSPADIGYYGGEIDGSYYNDQDADTLYDGWEVAHGLNPSIDDTRADLDHDNLTNLMEFWAGTFPESADTDRDGIRDGDEIVGGSDPNDWYSRPDSDGFATARVPDDFPSIQDAVRAMRQQGTIEVAPGTWRGDVRIAGRNVTLIPSDSTPGTMTIQATCGRAITAVWSLLNLRDFVVAAGHQRLGGGLYLAFTEGKLAGLTIRDNSAAMGGGLYLDYSDITVSQCTITDNWANEGDWYEDGGGLYASYANPTIDHTTISDNVATGDGGGVYLEASNPLMTCVEILGNSAREGGGIFAVASGPVLTQTVVAGNVASNYGGGLLMSTGSTPYILNSIFAYNSGENVYLPSNAEGVMYEFDSTDLYNPAGLVNHNLAGIDDGNFFVEPSFLSYDTLGQPSDLHLSMDSPLVNAGDELVPDPDGSTSDIGIYGGPVSDEWDRDRDGLPDYFWPGPWTDAPEGFNPADYDANDHDATVQ